MTDPTIRAEEGAKLYVLMKRGLYWRPDAQGYTGVLADAGLYTAEKAAAYTRHDDPSVKAILASEADEFSPACWEETKLARRDKQLADAEASASALRDRVAVLESALRSLEESLRPAEHVPFVDPVHGAAVEALGHRIGFGALMSSASASWAAFLEAIGTPGGEFVSGPCRSVLQADLRAARAALNGGPNV